MKKSIWPALLAAALGSLGMSAQAQAQNPEPTAFSSWEPGRYWLVRDRQGDKRAKRCIEIDANGQWKAKAQYWREDVPYVMGLWTEDDRYVYLLGDIVYTDLGPPYGRQMQTYIIDKKKRKDGTPEEYFNGMGSASAVLIDAQPQEWISHRMGSMMVYKNSHYECHF